MMPSVVMRRFAPSDEEALVKVWFEGWLSVGIDRPVVTREHFANRLPKDLAQRWDVTVAEVDTKVKGFLALVLSEQRLDQLFVAPEIQGQGIGYQLFRVAKVKMPDGFWLSTQLANTRARTFYERAGMGLDRIELSPLGDKMFYKFSPST